MAIDFKAYMLYLKISSLKFNTFFCTYLWIMFKLFIERITIQKPQYMQGYEIQKPCCKQNLANEPIDPKSQHESIEDEEWTSESFKQYQRECDEIMWEKPAQNPYDVQLTSEFNYSSNGKTYQLQNQFIFRFKSQKLFIWLLKRLKQGY